MLPPLPTWEGLHPLVIHFPIGVLFVVPLFLLLSFVLKRQEACFLLSGLVLLALGFGSVVVAIITGEAASLVVDMTPEIAAVLERHQDLAETVRNVFGVLTAILAGLVVIRTMFSGLASTRGFRWGLYVFFVVYLAAMGLLGFAAHQGGVLVHGLGVHASMK